MPTPFPCVLCFFLLTVQCVLLPLLLPLPLLLLLNGPSSVQNRILVCHALRSNAIQG
jgi:hypothetical protein